MQAVASGGSGDIFASYKQSDGGDALLMNMYHSLKPLDVWLDKMRGEERSEAGMVAGVKACRLFCAVISPAYFQSAFCLLEIRTALQHEKKIAVCYGFTTAASTRCRRRWVGSPPTLHISKTKS